MSATAFDVDLVCAQFDFFTCGSPRGSLRLALRRGFFCRLVHNSSLGDSGLQEKAESESLLQATLTPCRRDLLGGATSRSPQQQQQRPVPESSPPCPPPRLRRSGRWRWCWVRFRSSRSLC